METRLKISWSHIWIERQICFVFFVHLEQSNHTALILGVHVLRSYLKLICEYELHSLPNKNIVAQNDHGKNYIKVRPPLVRHLLGNYLLRLYMSASKTCRQKTGGRSGPTTPNLIEQKIFSFLPKLLNFQYFDRTHRCQIEVLLKWSNQPFARSFFRSEIYQINFFGFFRYLKLFVISFQYSRILTVVRVNI